MSQPYCYWSVATGPYAALMERSVVSARRSGVFKEFHVLTDRPIEGCECYDAQTVEKTDGMFKLIYLKAGMSKLLFDYFIWVDADSFFVRNPRNVLECLGKSPIHVPLTTNLSALAEEKLLRNGHEGSPLTPALSPLRGEGETVSAARRTAELTAREFVELMTAAGVQNPVYLSASSFWIVRREAIDRVVELATHFRAFAKEKGFAADVAACLGYAMQMLCANPEAHRLKARPDLWASDDQNHFEGGMPENTAWPLEDRFTGEKQDVNPSIIHLPHNKAFGREQVPELVVSEALISATKPEEREYAKTF